MLAAAPARAQQSDAAATAKIDRSLRDSLMRGGKTRRVIITVKPGYAAEIRRALQSHGDAINSESALVDTLAAEVHTDDVRVLAQHPGVAEVSDDAIVFAGSEPPVKLPRLKRQIAHFLQSGSGALSTSTLRQALGLPRLPDRAVPFAGTGIGVAVIDSGITPNLDFATRITAFYDFTRGGIATRPFDDYGHGTHIAGLIGSNGVLSGFQLTGVAPNVNLVGLKVLDKRG